MYYIKYTVTLFGSVVFNYFLSECMIWCDPIDLHRYHHPYGDSIYQTGSSTVTTTTGWFVSLLWMLLLLSPVGGGGGFNATAASAST